MKCICINAPIGDHGLEGFQLGGIYECETHMVLTNDNITSIRIYIIYDLSHDKNVIKSTIFKKYFKEV